jgi:hypothetical protein
MKTNGGTVAKTVNGTAITLHAALKLKNRLAGRLVEVTENIQTSNSRLEGSEAELDPKELWETRNKLSDALVTLKTAIHRANVEGGQQKRIFQIGEKKGVATLLKQLSTANGPTRERYSEETLTYVAFKKKKDVLAETRQLEREIDAIQTEIEGFNHTHKIEIAQDIVDLGN